MPFDIAALAQAARRFFWIPLIVVPVAFLASFIFAKTSTPMFRASAELRLESPMIAAAASPGSTAEGMSPEELNTVIKTFVNPVVAREVVKKLKLTERPYFNGGKQKFPPEDDLVTFLMANTKAAIVPGTRLLQISVDYRTPDGAMELANAMGEAGIKFDRDQRGAALQQNVRYLEDEVKKLEDNLVVSEIKLNDYTRQMGSISVDEELNIESDKLKDLNARAVDAQGRRLQIENAYKEIQAYRDDSDALLGIESIRSAPGVSTLIAKVNDLKGNLAKLLQRYRPGHPFVVQAKTELAQVEQSLRQQALDVAKGIEGSLAAAVRNEQGVAAEKAQQEEKVIKIQAESIPSKVLKRQVEADRMAYEAALKRLNEELSQTRSQLVMLQMSSPAGPGYMVSMGASKVVGGATLGGLFVSLGLIFLIAQLDKSIKTVEAAEAALKLSVLAAVPKYDKLHGKGELTVLDYPVLQDKYSAATEAFRTLRIAIDPPDSPEERPFFLMTGSIHGEGTSFCAINLAVMMGESGQRTLLVDGNLRKPALEERIFASSGHYGLSDYLTGQAQFSSIIRSTPADNVDVVTAGTPNAHPAEILARPRFTEFLEEARLLYDRVIFDSAPLTVVSDTMGFAHHCNTVCFVVRSGKTSPTSAKRALELLTRGGVTPVGVVLNNVSSLFPIKNRKTREPEEIIPVEDGYEFPVQCPSCHRSYSSADDFVQRTSPPGEDWVGTESTTSDRHQRIVRTCGCSALIVLPPVKRRDSSADGVHRREAFSELLAILQKGGLVRDEARTKLLLTVKMWRSEMNGDGRRENSEASQQRKKLFNEVLQHLVAGGLSEVEANTRLLHAIKIWQHAP